MFRIVYARAILWGYEEVSVSRRQFGVWRSIMVMMSAWEKLSLPAFWEFSVTRLTVVHVVRA